MPIDCPVFYRPEMSATTESFSASCSKPERIVSRWLRNGTIEAADVRSFEPVTDQDLTAVHDPQYVAGVLALITPNGFGNCDDAIARSLLYTSGSMLAAGRHAAEHGGLACSPSSGFHHAGYDQGGGFCTFNGLALTAALLAMQGYSVGILDCDAHYGDGTHDILRRIGLLGNIQHHTMGEVFPTGQRAKGFMGWLSVALDQLQACDVVLYQAGADPYILDPLGGQMTRKELAARDEAVFAGLKNVAWNLAGGYSGAEDILHTTTMRIAKGTSHDD